jgi:hypothetical protein
MRGIQLTYKRKNDSVTRMAAELYNVWCNLVHTFEYDYSFRQNL